MLLSLDEQNKLFYIMICWKILMIDQFLIKMKNSLFLKKKKKKKKKKADFITFQT